MANVAQVMYHSPGEKWKRLSGEFYGRIIPKPRPDCHARLESPHISFDLGDTAEQIVSPRHTASVGLGGESHEKLH